MTQFDARLYRARDYPRMPWRNGGGTTQEVACNPGGSTAGFEWRLSIADVGQDGGFSAFDGFQRIITVLEGAGIELTVDGRREPPLGPRRAYAFHGDARWTAACWTAPSATSTCSTRRRAGRPACNG